MAAHDSADIRAAVDALDGCVKLGESRTGEGPKASAVKLRGSRMHVVFLQQRNGQVELYRTGNEAKAKAMVADGPAGHGGCTDRAYTRDEAVTLALGYAANERQRQRKRGRDEAEAAPGTPDAKGAPAEALAPAPAAASAPVKQELEQELKQTKTALLSAQVALLSAQAALAAEKQRSAALGEELRRIRRVLSDSSAELTQASRDAEVKCRKTRDLLAKMFTGVDAVGAGSA